MVASAPSTRRRLPRADRERQTLEVARRLFAERGYAATTMDDVAAQVGVTKPLLYAYFGNKEGLYLACMEPAGEALLAAVIEAVEAADGPADAMARGARAFFDFVDRDRDAWRVLFDETVPAAGTVARRVAEYRERLTETVSAALLARMPSGARKRAAAEVEGLSAALLAASEALARWWLRTGAMSAREAADLLVSTIEPGLRARARRPRGGSR